MKINLKEIDFKQFFLQRGEWVGLGVALAIMLPVFFIGAKKALLSGSATANAQDLKKLNADANGRIQNAPVPADATEMPKDSEFRLTFAPVDPQKYDTEMPWFVPSTIEDTKRRAPVVLAPAELQPTVVRGGVKIYPIRFLKDGTKVEVIEEKKAAMSEKEKRLRKRLEKLLGNRMGVAGGPGGGAGMGMGGRGMGMGGMGGGPGMGMGGGMGGGPGMGMGMGGGRGMGMPGGPQGGRGGMTRNIRLLDLDKVKDDQNVRLAEELYPDRFVMVTGSFPYKEQLNAFRVALRKRTLDDLLAVLGTKEAEWKFLGFDIERRVYYPDGREKETWVKYDAEIRQGLVWLLARAVDTEKEDDALLKYKDYGILTAGLAWPRPQLDPQLGSTWPKVKVAGVEDSIAKLNEANTQTQKGPPSALSKQLRGENIDPFDPFGTYGKEEEKAQEPTPNKPEEGGDKDKDKAADDPPVAEQALVRFFDPTVQPGYTYEYRIKVRMANPNYKQDKVVAYPALAKDKEIVATDWTLVPKVTVPYDVGWYAIDEKPAQDKVLVQIQRWIDVLQPDPEHNPNSVYQVADWAVLDKYPAFRGEYLGKPNVPAEVPAWSKLGEDYELAREPSKRGGSTRVPVDFTVKQRGQPHAALLIDYEGGRNSQFTVGGKRVAEDVAVQMLVLSPEGRLEVHTNVEDLHDPARTEHFEAYKKRVDEVKRGGSRVKKAGQDLFDKGSMPGN